MIKSKHPLRIELSETAKKARKQEIESLIKKANLTEDEALAEIHHGFPIVQLIRFQEGKCYGCRKELLPTNNLNHLSNEDLSDLNDGAMQLDEIKDDYSIIGDDFRYRLFCDDCSGI